MTVADNPHSNFETGTAALIMGHGRKQLVLRNIRATLAMEGWYWQTVLEHFSHSVHVLPSLVTPGI